MGPRIVLLLRLLRLSLTDVDLNNSKTMLDLPQPCNGADDGCLDNPECLLELVMGGSCDRREYLLVVLPITLDILHTLLSALIRQKHLRVFTPHQYPT